jgi:hypothetical protein
MLLSTWPKWGRGGETKAHPKLKHPLFLLAKIKARRLGFNLREKWLHQ